ncbi:mobilization protein [Actinoplanes sp. OR16]|uniref:relaxase/mobilization nuclease domain-containing protein n=1 Tax=Actinoplanes sp. OR16 TaxID=946334 RepID=UPI000F6C5609|nr:relaxase/mobilization nuclease domain-containing protein [Actinoplanes sp. OR16]BBH67093.1 mobilization protein [Actinoplanes sp. OR16]
MIARVHRRSNALGTLLTYLWGPGRQEEHENPHLVAAWDGAGDLDSLQPGLGDGGRHDVSALRQLLNDPVAARRRPPEKPVWHCSVRLAREDRTLSDENWAHIAREVMAQSGLAPHGDLDAVRWIAMRHGDDHIHIAATLVRQDGRVEPGRNDYLRCRSATRDLEERYGLKQTAPADRTAHRRPHPVEVNKAQRKGWRETPRDELRRRVRVAAASATSRDEFFERLRAGGVLVRLRHSTKDQEQITGYAVALPGARTAGGDPVYYSGGRLAPDLTLPKLRERFGGPAAVAEELPFGDAAPAPSRSARSRVLSEARAAVRDAAGRLRRPGDGDGDGGQASLQATADVLTSTAYAVEGTAGGPLTEAADLFDRAVRDIGGQVARGTTHSTSLRHLSRRIALAGRVSGDQDRAAAVALLREISRLGRALEELRTAQRRLHQAEAAHRATVALRMFTEGGQKLVTEGGRRLVTPAQAVNPGAVAGHRTASVPQAGRGRPG